MAISIIDVAKDAGVSRMTVTRVMRNDSVSPKTRERVLQSMSKLGYVPSAAARAMRSSDPLVAARSKCFALVFGTDTLKANDFFSEVSRGIERAAANAGICPLHVHWVDDISTSWLRMQTVLSVEGLFGVLLVGEFSKKEVEAISNVNSNIVFVDAPPPAGIDARASLADYNSGCERALAHIIECGYRAPLLLTGPESHYFSKAMTNAMMERKDDFDEHKIITTDYTFEDGYRITLEELKKGNAVDAIFANDILCMGAMKALLESGVNVPHQVGVIGFDDIPSCAYLTPTLSSVRIDKEALGASAVELLLDKMGGGSVDKVTIGAQLIRRGSTVGSRQSSVGSEE